MPTSTRFDKETEEILKRAATVLGITKSEIVRNSVREYCLKIIEEKEKTPWEIYRTIHAPGGSGHGKRVSMQRELFKEKLEAKRGKWSL
ncbi:MAG: hypothetical protein AB1442_03205 [Nitrospirota bacterium]